MVKGSTLLEILIFSLLLSITFVFSTQIFLRVYAISPTLLTLSLETRMDSLASLPVGSFASDTVYYRFNDYFISQNVIKSNLALDNLYEIHLYGHVANKKKIVQKKLVYKYD